MEFPTISQSGITDDNSQLIPEIPTGVGTLTLGETVFCSKTCLATVLIRSIFAREKLHERFSASAVFQRKIERINQ